MRPISLLLAGFMLSLSLSLASTGCLGVQGSGVAKTQERQLAAFDAVDVSSALTVQITLSPDQAQKVVVSGDDNIVELVRTSLAGTTLVVDLEPNTTLQPRLPLLVTISAKALHDLQARGSSTATATALSGDDVRLGSDSSSSVHVQSVTAEKNLTIDVSASSSLEAANIAAKNHASASIDTSSSLKLAGSALDLTATVSHSSSLQADGLTAGAVVITSSGSSSAEVCATTSLQATVSTSSTVAYHCNPTTVTKTVDDSSTLSKK